MGGVSAGNRDRAFGLVLCTTAVGCFPGTRFWRRIKRHGAASTVKGSGSVAPPGRITGGQLFTISSVRGNKTKGKVSSGIDVTPDE